MGVFEWNQVHSVGVEAIDDQHKRLLAITDRLFEAIMAGKGFEELLGFLHEMRDYAEYHFQFEEDLLAENGFPEAEIRAHAREHAALKAQVDEFIDGFSPNSETMDIEVFDFLRDWTTEHLGGTDMEYKDFFSGLKLD